MREEGRGSKHEPDEEGSAPKRQKRLNQEGEILADSIYKFESEDEDTTLQRWLATGKAKLINRVDEGKDGYSTPEEGLVVAAKAGRRYKSSRREARIRQKLR